MIESDLVVERNRKEVRIFPSRPRKKEMYEQDEHVLVVQKRGADDGESEKEKMGAKEEKRKWYRPDQHSEKKSVKMPLKKKKKKK